MPRLSTTLTLLLLSLMMACAPADPPPPPASPTATLALQSQTLPPTATLTPQPTATATPTVSPSPSPTIINTNTATATASPTSTASPSPSPIPAPPTPQPTETAPPSLRAYESSLTLPTYPYEAFLYPDTDPVYSLTVRYLDRSAYTASQPQPQAVTYQTVVLENRWLRLTFIPALGGRLYSAVIKATEQEIFYHNPVVKPSGYGGLHFDGRQPFDSNWWLALGGMEWAYPIQEHGYRWGEPWSYRLTQSETAVSLTLSDLAPGRIGAEVTITLPADRADFAVSPRVVNQGETTVPVQLWLNAALSLAEGGMSPQTRFIVPTDSVLVHSRGAEGWLIPGERDSMPWPQVNGLDLTTYATWKNYLGFFVPDLAGPFMAVYNPETRLGVVRLVEPETVPGHKLFAFSQNFAARSYTDDGSQYVELWGGLNRGFWPSDDLLLAPGESRQWTERWWPLANIGGVTWATETALLWVEPGEGDSVGVRLVLGQAFKGQVEILAGETVLLSEPLWGGVDSRPEWRLSTAADSVRVRLVNEEGAVVLAYPGQ